MGPVQQLQTVATDPVIAVRWGRRMINHADGTPYNTDGDLIFDQDWDNLIILDACRYDIFRDTIGDYDIPGQLSSITSRGSQTPEWVRGNFTDRQEHDTVYVSASSWYLKLKDSINSEVHDFIGVIGEEYRDSSVETIPPQHVTETAREASRQYPDKRLLIHYVQPHMPYLGDLGEREFKNARSQTMREMIREKGGGRDEKAKLLRWAYQENLHHVLNDIESLVDDLHGKTVISADHGEFLGERPGFSYPFVEYGHPGGIYYDTLVNVPWFTADYDSRKNIRAETPVQGEGYTEEELNSQLRALGYKE